MAAARVRRTGQTVAVEINGVAVCDMPPEAARRLARALAQVAGGAEEEREAERIAWDQALMMRAGLPLGLTGRADIVAEARKLMTGDRLLRTAPAKPPLAGIASAEAFGLPSVRVEPAP